MIPENKNEAIAKALQTAFGISEFEDIRQLHDGLSTALIFRIVVLGKPYLLRVITRTDSVADPGRWYNCMQAAADAGIAPKVWYADSEDRVCITDFVNAKPFPLDVAKLKLAATLSRLHALPPFPFRLNYLDAIEGFVEKFKAAELIPAELTADLLPVFTQIKNIYPRNTEDLVACHNDLKPENMLYDGERVWLVDWEAAFLNDRYMDLSIAANFVVRNDEDEKDYLQAYFGAEVSKYQFARFFLARQLMHFSYFVVFMLMGQTPGKTVDPFRTKPTFREFNDRVWAGEISLADMDNRVLYSLVHMEQLRINLQSERFKAALALVAG